MTDREPGEAETAAPIQPAPEAARPREEEAAAVACVARAAARSWLMRSSAFAESVTSVGSHAETYRRALYLIEHRAIRVRLAPGHGTRPSDLRASPDPAAVDPWAVEPRRLEEETRVVATCPTCSGKKTVACARCGGSARVRCGECAGSGKVQGQRGLKNCPTCRGRGDEKCLACQSGRVPCEPCGASGRVFAWLALEQQTLSQVKSHPDCAARSVHASIDVPADFDAGPDGWPNQLVEDGGVVLSPKTWDSDLAPMTDARADRVLSMRVQTFASVVYEIAYATALSASTIRVAGNPPAVAGPSDWKPLARRRLLLAAVAATCVLAAMRVQAGYLARHSWFAQYGHAGAVLWSGLVAGALTIVAVAGLTLARPARSRNLTSLPAGLAGAALIATLLAYVVGGPTRAGAEHALTAGDFARARVEAAALIDLGTDRAGGEQIDDALHAKRVEQSDGPFTMAAEIAKPWHDDARRAAALQTLHAAADEVGARLYAQHDTRDLDALASSLDELDPPLAQRLHGHACVLRALEQVAQRDFASAKMMLDKAALLLVPPEEVARGRETLVEALDRRFHELVQVGRAPGSDPHGRRDALDAALALSMQHAVITGSATDPTAEVLQDQLALVRKDVEAADKRAAEIAAQEEAKRKREEAVAEAKRKQEEALAEAKRRAEEAANDDDPGRGSSGRRSKGGGRVQVREYTRKDGTRVQSHTRSR